MMQPMLFGFETEYKLIKFMDNIQGDPYDLIEPNFASQDNTTGNEVATMFNTKDNIIHQVFQGGSNKKQIEPEESSEDEDESGDEDYNEIDEN